MVKTFKKEIKWRRDRNALFICDCKRLIDLKLSHNYENFLKRLSKGIEPKQLDEPEIDIYKEFEKINFLTDLIVKPLPKNDFPLAMQILDNELGTKRVRSKEFLKEKYKKFSEYFIGIYLGEELVGVICGFPREDYLLIGEIAVDIRFQRRNFGKKLVGEFEKIGFKRYNKINVGAKDKTIEFYKKMGYKPFLLIQFEKEYYTKEDFSEFKILNIRGYGIEVETKNFNLGELNNLRKKYPKATFQYVFTKENR